MSKNNLKTIVSIFSLIILLSNITTIFAQTIELQINGGFFEIKGPDYINLNSITSSISGSSQQINLRDLAETTPSESLNNHIRIIDRSGGNPFNVTITISDNLKLDETLSTTSITGSGLSTLKATSTNNFYIGDTIHIVDTVLINPIPAITYTITAIPDSTTFTISPDLITPPTNGSAINRFVNCDISPKKCFSLNNFAIKNKDSDLNSTNDITTIYGEPSDLTLNSSTETYNTFGGETTTQAGSTGNTLLVNDSSVFNSGEDITFISETVSPSTNTITNINANEITLLNSFTNGFEPAENTRVRTSTFRTLTISNGTGNGPGDWLVFPSVSTTSSPGLHTGEYGVTLNLTIV